MTSKFIHVGQQAVYGFTIGQLLELTTSATPYSAAGAWLPTLRKWTRWWRPRYIVTGIDRSAGAIRVVEQLWSWSCWKWMP